MHRGLQRSKTTLNPSVLSQFVAHPSEQPMKRTPSPARTWLFVECDPGLPAHIAAHVERLSGMDTTRNAGGADWRETRMRHRTALMAALAKRIGANVGRWLVAALARVNGGALSTLA
jgi:hypothetical protein